ncbi:TBC1 domain family member 20 isoform X2 [Aethina tumida]|uniref:TBC1 domain family member 20 isoform X2 n=1 Tax=Aethina tumida TaxID=116153 RepID=UPI002148EBA9|nr:TBC1 domain family member 20 isoform X2 [Aethina tumida]
MDNHTSEISSLDESTSPLNNESPYKNVDDTDVDTRSELKFDQDVQTPEETDKKKRIESALSSGASTLKTWKDFALVRHGLVSDDLRRKVWPLLLEVDPESNENTPSLQDLSNHPEYDQVVVDVNRSLRRFPPGIPYEQRVALQDQLTVLILRVIIKYPHLRYYQGYHDVAVTFLLVVGEAVAFRIMEKLSTHHLRECMEPTMEKTDYRLNYIYSLLKEADKDLHDFMDRAEVGTMFALPWYLTWFGHSLNQYRDVVRLYDYFLASPPLMPLYVATALVIHRRQEVFDAGCDMASVHVVLSQIPDNLDFEEILVQASKYYKNYPPDTLEGYVKKRIHEQTLRRRRDQEEMRRRQNRNKSLWVRLNKQIGPWLLVTRGKYGLLFAAATVIIGFYAYYLKYTESSRLPIIRKLGHNEGEDVL